MPRIDLHTHSNRSDGTFEPAEVVRLAAERALDVVALTDHDTTDGLAEGLATGSVVGVEVVPGVEFSAEFDGNSVHVLCYWMDPHDAALQLELRRLREDRFRRGELMVGKLQELGLPVAFQRVRAIAGDATIVRPHIAQAMVEAGVVATEKEAFERYIGDGGPAHVAKHALDPLNAVALIDGTDFLLDRADARMDLAEVLRLAGRSDEAAQPMEEALRLYEEKGNLVSAERACALLAELGR